MLFRLPLPGPAWAALLLFWGSWLGFGKTAQATHIVGGEMELVHNTGESYTLLLNLYFDAVNGNVSVLDADLTASIFEKSTNNRMTNVVLPLSSNTFVNYTNPACAQPTLSTRKLVYSKLITLTADTYNSPQGYYVAVERCCRNYSISNIVAPNNAAQTFYLEFPAVVRGGKPFYDSTPRIFPALADYACRNELFYYDFGGQDADGDSLVYDLVTPLNGHANATVPKPAAADAAPYALIKWNPGLSTLNQIPGAPTLEIGRNSGRLTVRPTSLGLFVFGVRCAEYRRGEKIGESRRDFQLMVLNCAVNTKPSLKLLPAPASPTTYRPGRDTLHFVPGGNRCVRLRFTDPDPNSRLTLSLTPVNFSGLLPTFTSVSSGAVRTAGAPDTLTATLCFPECMNSRGRVFLLDVVVGDDGCSLPKRDTVRVAFTAVPPGNTPPTIAATAGPALPLRVRVGDLVAFDVTGTDLDYDPVQLEMTGLGFSPGALGATLAQGTAGNQQRGRFTWRVDCRAVGPDSVFTFRFAAATSPCSTRDVATISVPVVVSYANHAPVLASSLPVPKGAEIPLLVLPLGRQYTATFTGTDADRDGLTLTASGTSNEGKEGFDLAAAGMRFQAFNGTGAANGTFSWDVSCAAANLHRELTVTFQLVDATCKPLPQVQRVRLQVKSPDSLAVKLYNVITPNRDGQNDEFRLPDLPPNFCDAQFASIRIFSRWGQQVFESQDREFRWPGQGNGGLYYYFVSYTDGRRYRGWLEVIR
ncbi:gliding motility-associated C-terminal domain-containing protein [Hymenobacter sedentarius]|uniref:T9SS type B sorting domain-containing protein n=1 Tax=Hymenobacter sedentarius TaxID=1411621 RepID=UPI0009EC0EEA|nr:gliding motility-associated C-terminal domain-containing protein [Hymenobacter sedentarius]